MVVGSFGDTDRLQLEAAGFVLIDQFLSHTAIESLDAEVTRICRERSSSGPGLQDGALVMTNLEATSDYIFDFARERQIIEFVEQAMQGPIVPLNVELFIKPPRSQGITPAHQDHAFCRFKETTTILTCWIALDDAAREGGALEYARGRFSRLMPHKPHEEIHFSFELCDASELTFDSVPVRRAGCLIHHGFAIHRSGPNLLNYPRRAVAFAYRGCRDR